MERRGGVGRCWGCDHGRPLMGTSRTCSAGRAPGSARSTYPPELGRHASPGRSSCAQAEPVAERQPAEPRRKDPATAANHAGRATSWTRRIVHWGLLVIPVLPPILAPLKHVPVRVIQTRGLEATAIITGMTTPKPKRRWFQYSLRTLLVVVTLCAIFCSWLAVKLQQAKREREAAAAITELGGEVRWWSRPSRPEWLRKLLGGDLFMRVEEVQVSGDTDQDWQNLKALSQLRVLYLDGTNITDKRLENLRGLSQLQILGLSQTNISDNGLESIKGLSQLQVLYIRGEITPEGIEKLKSALPNCKIIVNSPLWGM